MRVGERTDGVVVSLFEGFKVEGGPVPDGELTHLIACQTPAAIGCPLPVSGVSDEKNIDFNFSVNSIFVRYGSAQ
jgi:hypothetical protein